MYNEHFVPCCAIPWQGLPFSQGWRPIKGTQFMSSGRKKTSLHFNYRIVQESRNPGHRVEFLRYFAKGGTGREVKEMGSAFRTNSLLPADTLTEISQRQVSRSPLSDHALWSVLREEMWGPRIVYSITGENKLHCKLFYVKMAHCQSEPRHKNQKGQRLPCLIQ